MSKPNLFIAAVETQGKNKKIKREENFTKIVNEFIF
jgi:hypothetical protein